MAIKDKASRQSTHGEIEQNLDVFGQRSIASRALVDVFKNGQGKKQMSSAESSHSKLRMQERML